MIGDDRRVQAGHDHQSFAFLSYTFRARSVKTKWGTLRVGFIPAISDKAKKGIRDEVRDWRLVATMNNKTLDNCGARQSLDNFYALLIFITLNHPRPHHTPRWENQTKERT